MNLVKIIGGEEEDGEGGGDGKIGNNIFNNVIFNNRSTTDPTFKIVSKSTFLS